MLKLQPDPTFTAPARIRVPGGEAVEIQITWRHKGRKEFEAWFASAAEKDDADLLAEVIAGWGAEIDAPYSAENLARLLDQYPAAAQDLVLAYGEALYATRLKN